MVSSERLIQDLEYYTSQKDDIINSLKKQRLEQRNTIISLLKTKIPDVFDDILSPGQQRLLRVFKFQPTGMTEEEKLLAIKLKNYMNSIRTGQCYNIKEEKQIELEKNDDKFEFNISGFPMKFCVSVRDSVNNGMVNSDLSFVDVMLTIPSNATSKLDEIIRFPLDEDDSEFFLGKIYEIDIDLDSNPRMTFADLDEVQDNIYETRNNLEKTYLK